MTERTARYFDPGPWDVEFYPIETHESPYYRTFAASGFGQGRCGCGWNTDPAPGRAERAEAIPAKLLDHIDAEHAEWAPEITEQLRQVVQRDREP